MQEWFAKLANDFAQTFITKDRWQLFAKGFTVTIRVAILALLMQSVYWWRSSAQNMIPERKMHMASAM